MVYIIIFLVIIIVLLAINTFLNNDKQKEKIVKLYPYKKKYLLTKNEWNFYKGIKNVCDEENLHILAKIRLADLIEVDGTVNKNEKIKYFNMISKKHIDFALCKKENLEVLCLIELDDNSHNAEKRKNRDLFVDESCKKAGYKLIHTYGSKNFKEILIENKIIESEGNTNN